MPSPPQNVLFSTTRLESPSGTPPTFEIMLARSLLPCQPRSTLCAMLLPSAVPLPPPAWACQYQLTSESPALLCSITHVALCHCSTSNQVKGGAGSSSVFSSACFDLQHGSQVTRSAGGSGGGGMGSRAKDRRASSVRSLQGSVFSGCCLHTSGSSPNLCRWQRPSCGARPERCDRSPELHGCREEVRRCACKSGVF